jgi:dTDP-glucose 4,6-dehydratase
MKIIVTGGAGFIGSCLVRKLIEDPSHTVLNIDKLTYAANPHTLDDVKESNRYRFHRVDITDRPAITQLITSHRPDLIFHLAAESHVDRSLVGAEPFLTTNILGTHVLLECALTYWRSLSKLRQPRFRFIHISTDEVYGSLGAEGYFTEQSPYAPNSPYSASKAAADHLVRAWHESYGLPTIITHASNNYGPYQFPEKLIPLIIARALARQPLPVYGDGQNVRDWLFVEDHVDALCKIARHGIPGNTYNVGGNCERTNIEVVNTLCDALDQLAPRSESFSHRSLITFVTDRPGHDRRYAIDGTKLARELDWGPRMLFAEGILQTVQWYLKHQAWWQTAESIRAAA